MHWELFILFLITNEIAISTSSQICQKQPKRCIYSRASKMMSCQKSECLGDEFPYECGIGYCTQTQMACHRFLIGNSFIKSMRSATRNRNSFDEEIGKCSTDSFQLSLNNVCNKALNCSVSKILTAANLLIALKKSVSCGCSGERSYDCNSEFCTKNAQDCTSLLVLYDRRSFIYSKVEQCMYQ